MPIIILLILAFIFGYSETDLHNLIKGYAKENIQDQAQTQPKSDEQDQAQTKKDLLSYIFSKKWQMSGLPCSHNGGTYQVFSSNFKTGVQLTIGGKLQQETQQLAESSFEILDEKTFRLVSAIFSNGNGIVEPKIGPNKRVQYSLDEFTLLDNKTLQQNRMEHKQMNFDLMLKGVYREDKGSEWGKVSIIKICESDEQDQVQSQIKSDEQYQAQTKKDEQLSEEEVSGMRAGFCYGALLKAKQNGDFREFPNVTGKYKKEIIKKCGKLDVNKDCHEKLSMPARFFWGAAGKAVKELSSSAPTTLLKSNPPGNWAMTIETVILSYCMATERGL